MSLVINIYYNVSAQLKMMPNKYLEGAYNLGKRI